MGQTDLNPKLWPRWSLPCPAGLSCAAQRLARLPAGCRAHKALSCGRDRVRWPCCWLLLRAPPAVEPVASRDSARPARSCCAPAGLSCAAPRPHIPAMPFAPLPSPALERERDHDRRHPERDTLLLAAAGAARVLGADHGVTKALAKASITMDKGRPVEGPLGRQDPAPRPARGHCRGGGRLGRPTLPAPRPGAARWCASRGARVGWWPKTAHVAVRALVGPALARWLFHKSSGARYFRLIGL